MFDVSFRSVRTVVRRVPVLNAIQSFNPVILKRLAISHTMSIAQKLGEFRSSMR